MQVNAVIDRDLDGALCSSPERSVLSAGLLPLPAVWPAFIKETGCAVNSGPGLYAQEMLGKRSGS